MSTQPSNNDIMREYLNTPYSTTSGVHSHWQANKTRAVKVSENNGIPWQKIGVAIVLGGVALATIGLLAQFGGLDHVGSLSMTSVQHFMNNEGYLIAGGLVALGGTMKIFSEDHKEKEAREKGLKALEEAERPDQPSSDISDVD